jgi:peptidoglycan/LPS O-acetylase OafA/YrhL
VIEKSYSIDVLKFILSCCVVALHYNWELIPRGYLSVEFFFIISGFSFYRFSNMRSTNPIKIIKKIYLIYIASIILTILLASSKYDILSIVLASLMMQSLGINDTVINVPTWFLCVYAFVVPCIVYAYNFMDKRGVKCEYILLLVPILIYFILSNSTPSTGFNYSYEFKVAGLTVGILRCIAAVCIGIFSGVVSEGVSIDKRVSNPLSITLFAWIVYIFSFSGFYPSYDYVSISIMAMMLILIVSGNNIVSFILDRTGRRFPFLGKLSVYVFIFHYPILTVINEGGRITALKVVIILLTAATLFNKERIISLFVSAKRPS